MKLKLSTGGNASSPGGPSSVSQPPTPLGTIKLKIKTSAPPTPVTEKPIPQAEPLGPPPTKPKKPYNKKPKGDDGPSKKRAADSDISPAAKRASNDEPKRRISFKVGSKISGGADTAPETPTSAGPKIKLGRKQSTGPKNITLTTKRRPPPRPVGVGYDSEASDAEQDPAIEQQFILRMAPGEDCTYLNEAIANKTIGLRPEEGGADVAIKFVDRDLKRAMVTVRGRRYAACMVDLPSIVEGMKSFDRRGWWKVADICQMLLVLGRCKNETEAKDFALPKEVDKNTLAYPHGLTPPMHWVRKRRFRKRVSYREIENVEEEVERLLKEDAACKRNGGSVNWHIYDADAMRQADATQQEEDYPEEDEYMETTEDQYGQAAEAEDEEFDDLGLAEQLAAGLEEEDEDESVMADAAASLGGAMAAETPSSATQQLDTSAAETPASVQQEESSDEDEDDDDVDSPDAIDEDAIAMANEEAQKRSEIEDLEREVQIKRQELERTTNQLLKQRTRQNLKALEDELAMKRKAFDMEEEEEEEEDDDDDEEE